MPIEEYILVLRGERFLLSSDQLHFDAPNYFTVLFEGPLQEANEGKREVVLYRDPHLFRIIETYLSGYQIFPLPDDGWPKYMSKEAARKNLMDDAKFYGLDKLVHLLEENAAATAAKASPVEEKKEKEKELEKRKEKAHETAPMTAVLGSTPSIWTAGTLKSPTGSLAGGTPPSGIRVAPSFRPTRETQFCSHAPAATIGGRFTANMDEDEDADEGAPSKEELERAAKNVPVIHVPAGFKLGFGKGEVSLFLVTFWLGRC
jgi:hypothetical protein